MEAHFHGTPCANLARVAGFNSFASSFNRFLVREP